MAAKDSPRSLIREYGSAVFLAVVAAFFIRAFLIEAYRIPSHAMRPSLEPGDTIFVAKWSFGLRFPGFDAPLTHGRSPRHGEIVVFSMQDGSRRDYIKRVVGLEGDTVMLRGGHLFINGKPSEVVGSQHSNCYLEKTDEEKTYPVCLETPLPEDFGPLAIAKGSVFLIGDTRTQGSSKSWGNQPLQSLRGSALWIWLSVEPESTGVTTRTFPSLRSDRMFRRIQ